MKIILSIFFCLMVIFSSHAQSINQYNIYLKDNNQVLFVKMPSDSSVQGSMFLYERKNNNEPWLLTDSFNIVVGKSGLAKDASSNIIFNNSIPTKHEGDGKSPAGIFKLGPVFSYHSIQNLHMPFVKVDTNYLCVDDENSIYYNTLVLHDTTSKHDYNSFEYMKRNDSFYEYGVWVKYNSDDIKPGNGSCIFLHIWRDEHSGTSGCTAMTKENILKLIYWLDESKNPVLLQIVKN